VLEITISADGAGRWLLAVEDSDEVAAYPSEAAAFQAAESLCGAEGLDGWLLVRTEDGEWGEVALPAPLPQ
jgi:hypothetical protein